VSEDFKKCTRCGEVDGHGEACAPEEEGDCGGTGIAVIAYDGDQDVEGKCPGCKHPDCPVTRHNRLVTCALIGMLSGGSS
jgi:hypothetical protein